MIIDVNAYLGHFAFRRLRHNTAESLLKLMDARKIDRAVVSSASAITYRNPQAGNEEVDGEVKAHRDRLIPFAVINPSYAGWEDDLKTCHERLRHAGAPPLPRAGTTTGSPTRAASTWSRGHRARHDRLDPDPRRGPSRAELAGRRPRRRPRRGRRARAGLPRGAVPPAQRHRLSCARPWDAKASGLPANYRIEISRLTRFLDDELGTLIKSLGADRIVFGTGMPFSYPDPALLKLEVLTVSPEEKEKIAWRNAAEWLPGDR